MADHITVKELVDNVRLKVLQGEEYLQRPITTSDISRPALEFAGYFKHYPATVSYTHLTLPTILRV